MWPSVLTSGHNLFFRTQEGPQVSLNSSEQIGMYSKGLKFRSNIPLGKTWQEICFESTVR